MKIDCVFSIRAHESFDCVKDLIENINIATKDELNIFIVVHCNDVLFNSLQTQYINSKNIIINPDYKNIGLHTIELLQCHVNNFLFVEKYDFDYFCILASNCMFIKKFGKKNIEEKNFTIINRPDDIDKTSWHWPNFFQNHKLVSVFEKDKIEFSNTAHEGAFVSKQSMKKICDYIYDRNLFHLIEKNTFFEEIILPMLEIHFNKNNELYRICKVFWNSPNISPNIEDIENICKTENSPFYCVKRIARNYNDPVRVYIRTKCFQ